MVTNRVVFVKSPGGVVVRSHKWGEPVYCH